MKMRMDDYILNKLKEDKEVKIILKRIMRKYKDYGVKEIDWIIDDKFILKDMPIEVFEGEELKLDALQNKEVQEK